MSLQAVKNRFGIIGNDARLNAALETAIQIASTDLSVLITGESGVGKEIIPQVIHASSPRKHNKYIAINCGAIPEGTIDSELFGHEKGSFTGANDTRKGYFEEADGGTVFLDEVGELPLQSQVRLLRVLQNGEFIKVGSSKVQKTDVRIIAASNVNFLKAINMGTFREDLYYRLNAVPIFMPPLRERGRDIHLLFRKFALDFSDKYQMPVIRLTPEAQHLLETYRWPGNIRQLKNVAEQISVLEENRVIKPETILKYLPKETYNPLPILSGVSHNNTSSSASDNISDRDIIFKILVQLREEVDQIKATIKDMSSSNISTSTNEIGKTSIVSTNIDSKNISQPHIDSHRYNLYDENITDAESEEIGINSLSIQEVNADLISKALEKYNGKRKPAAKELGISERTLYRKIKELNIEDKR